MGGKSCTVVHCTPSVVTRCDAHPACSPRDGLDETRDQQGGCGGCAGTDGAERAEFQLSRWARHSAHEGRPQRVAGGAGGSNTPLTHSRRGWRAGKSSTAAWRSSPCSPCSTPWRQTGRGARGGGALLPGGVGGGRGGAREWASQGAAALERRRRPRFGIGSPGAPPGPRCIRPCRHPDAIAELEWAACSQPGRRGLGGGAGREGLNTLGCRLRRVVRSCMHTQRLCTPRLCLGCGWVVAAALRAVASGAGRAGWRQAPLTASSLERRLCAAAAVCCWGRCCSALVGGQGPV